MIFVDTSYWIALRARRERRHADASRLWYMHAGTEMLTSNLVRGETWTFIRRRYGHASAVSFLDTLDRAARVEVMPVSTDIEGEALVWLHRHDEREYSFVDATSFALMRSLGIQQALAFGGDFSAAGFSELRA